MVSEDTTHIRLMHHLPVGPLVVAYVSLSTASIALCEHRRSNARSLRGRPLVLPKTLQRSSPAEQDYYYGSSAHPHLLLSVQVHRRGRERSL